MKQTNQNFIYKNFLTAIKDLKQLKTYFWFSFFLFFFIGIIGLLFPIFFQEKIFEIIRDLIKQTEGLGALELITFITTNNLQSAFLGMILGIFLGVFPLSILIINGYVLGFVANKSINAEGILILWRLLPHGIFEIPAILISVALGLKIGISIMQNCIKHYNKNISNLNLYLLIILSILFFPISFIIYITSTIISKNLRNIFYNNLKNSFRIFFLIVIPLLVIAGFIEGILIWLLA